MESYINITVQNPSKSVGTLLKPTCLSMI